MIDWYPLLHSIDILLNYLVYYGIILIIVLVAMLLILRIIMFCLEILIYILEDR